MIRRYVSFMLASSRCCLPVEQVLQIMRPENLLEVPRTPPFVEGVINLHGDILPVIDLRRRLGMNPPRRFLEEESRKRRIVIVRLGQRSCGLDVDEVREIAEVEDSSVQAGPAGLDGGMAPFVSAVAHGEESPFLVLDLEKVLDAGHAVPAEAG